MLSTISALGPIFLMIGVGYGLRHFTPLPAKAWLIPEKLSFYVFLPSLIVHKLSTTRLGEIEAGTLATAMVGGVLVLALLLVVLRKPLCRLGRFEGPGFTSVFQGATRSNFFISLVAIDAVMGHDGTVRAIIGFALLPPLSNVLSVVALARYAGETPAGGKKVFLILAKNPFIYAGIVGVVLNLTGVGSPPVVGPVLGLLSQAALPVALVCVGSGLDFSKLRGGGRGVIMGVVLKLAVLPAIVFAICRILGMDALDTAVAVVFHTPPAAAVSYVMARQMGGDYTMMAGILTLQMALAAITIPAILFLVVP